MTRLYFDLETERKQHQAFTDENILAVGYIIDRADWWSVGEHTPDKEVKVLAEWSESFLRMEIIISLECFTV